MKKRNLILFFLLLFTLPLFAAQDYSDIGQLVELDVVAKSSARAEINNSSSSSLITKEEIESYNVATVAELIGKATGTTFSSYGGEGSAQSIQIRGISSSKTLIFINGIAMTGAHDSSFDLASIPVSAVESIEIIKSGHGNLGRTNGIGGIVNIILKKESESDYPFLFSFENGSFLPLPYGENEAVNWLSLVDSQKLNLGFSTRLNGFNLVANVGGTIAQNNYTYSTDESLSLMEGAEFKKIEGSFALNGKINPKLSLSSHNMVAFGRIGTPGSLTYQTLGNWQQDLSVTTLNSLTLESKVPYLDTLTFTLLYDYRQTFFKDLTYTDSLHHKHKGNLGFNQQWNIGQNYSLESGFNLAIDFVDSTDINQHTRLSPSLFANGSIYLLKGKFSLHPSFNLLYLSDTQEFSPNASLGAVWEIVEDLDLKATFSYAELVPSFSQLYWPYMGNAELKNEKGINFDLALTYANKIISYEGIGFFRDVNNAIAYDDMFIPQNIEHSLYMGTEQIVELNLTPEITIALSYLFNQTYDVSGDNTIQDALELASVRKHTAKGSISYQRGIVQTILEGQLLGKSGNLETAFVANLIVNLRLMENLKTYVAIDNLFNGQYQTYKDYPMPPLKMRLGGSWQF